MNATQKMASYFIMINIVNFIVGAVPVIVVLTKADALNVPACQQLKKEGLEMCQEMMPRVEDYATQLLSVQKWKIESELHGSRYPPKAYISTACK